MAEKVEVSLRSELRRYNYASLKHRMRAHPAVVDIFDLAINFGQTHTKELAKNYEHLRSLTRVISIPAINDPEGGSGDYLFFGGFAIFRLFLNVAEETKDRLDLHIRKYRNPATSDILDIARADALLGTLMPVLPVNRLFDLKGPGEPTFEMPDIFLRAAHGAG